MSIIFYAQGKQDLTSISITTKFIFGDAFDLKTTKTILKQKLHNLEVRPSDRSAHKRIDYVTRTVAAQLALMLNYHEVARIAIQEPYW